MNTTIKKIVKEVLQEIEPTRDNDTLLIMHVLKRLGYDVGVQVKETGEPEFYIHFRSLHDLPSFETITRCRREIQNTQNQHVPTNAEVVRRRTMKAQEYRQYYSRWY